MHTGNWDQSRRQRGPLIQNGQWLAQASRSRGQKARSHGSGLAGVPGGLNGVIFGGFVPKEQQREGEHRASRPVVPSDMLAGAGTRRKLSSKNSIDHHLSHIGLILGSRSLIILRE